MSRPVRLQARDPAISCLVQAPAGSGKTELLTQRILALLAIVDEPEEILALTFTRKAAAEMRRRVMDALGMPRPEGGDASSHRLETWALAQRALERSAEKGWDLPLNPSRLRIMTLDSLCHALAAQLPLLSGLGQVPTPMDAPQGAYLEAAEAALEHCRRHDPEAAASVLLHLDHDSAVCIRLLADMLGRREQWLGEIARHGRDMPALRREQEEHASLLMTSMLAQADALMPDAVRDRLPELMRYAAAQLGGEEGEDIALNGWPAVSIACLPQWKTIADFLLTQKGELRRSINKNHGFPSGPEHADAKQAMLDLLAMMREVDGLEEALRQVAQLPDSPRMDEGQWQVICSLFRLLLLANQELVTAFARNGEADFTEIALRALDALGAYDASPGELLLRMDYRIRHILVDEFQDTSLMQMRLLQCLTSGWQEGDGMHRTLFLVGDPMQSIYRFRKAEVALFMQAAANEAGLPPLEPLMLERNFRSSPAIVDWVNRAFARIFPAREDPLAGAVAHARATAALQHDGVVELNLMHGDDPELEATCIVELIQRELEARSADAPRIGVLARSRKHLQHLMPALDRVGIAYRAVQIQGLGQRPEIRLLRALLRALSHPLDRVAWAALLKAPCCGLEHRDLHALLAEEDGADAPPVWSRMHDEQRLGRLPAESRARVLFLREALRPGVELFSRVPLRPLLASVWQRLHMPELLDAQARENVGTVLDLVESLEQGGLVDLQELDRRLEDLHAAADASPQAARVELMTMHGAKGLQWDVVILPGLGRTGQKTDSPLIAFTEVPMQGSALPLMAARPRMRDEDAFYSLVQGFERQKDEQELRRLLYVACTRAKTRLYLFGHVSETKGEAAKGSLLQLILEADEQAFGAKLRQLGAGAGRIEGDSPPARPTRVRVVPAAPEDIRPAATEIEYSWAGPEAAPVGTAVHAALQLLAERGRDDVEPAVIRDWIRRRLVHLGLSGELLSRSVDKAMQAVEVALGSRVGRWILDVHADSHCEWPLSDLGGGELVNRVIDRSFVDEQARWIIDYKTSSHEGGDIEGFLVSELARYRPQLEGYAKLLRRLEPERPIRAAIYFPLLDALREIEVPEDDA